MRKNNYIVCFIMILLGLSLPGCDNDTDYKNYVYPPAEMKTNLESLINECTVILNESEEGNGKGQYLSHFIKNFQTAESAARMVLNNDKATQPMVDAAFSKLTNEKAFFLSSVNEEGVDPNDENLALHLRFNGNTTDSSPKGHVLELNPGNSLSGNGPRPSYSVGRFGRENMAMHFENGGFISIPYVEGKSESLNPEVMTFMCWIKESNPPAPAQRWLFCLDSWNIFYVVMPAEGNEIQFGGQSTRGWLNLMNAGFEATSDWSHIAVTYSPQKISFYKNGRLVSTHAGNGGNLVRNGGNKPFLIGIMDSTRELYYSGDMDEFRLYNKDLSENEVKSVFDIEKPN